ncbi:hypothetical protein HY491_01615 [Candidatus Woesearchaeota archaeon]|nr:hypothetical protein [Candidatus Woesearchaeota archaeon]
MANPIYALPAKQSVVFPDVTVQMTSQPELGRFLLVHSDAVLFPEASNSLEGAQALRTVLSNMQKSAEDASYSPSIQEVRRFGIQHGAEAVVQAILEQYVAICREMKEKKLGFGPGLQYNFQQLTDKGIEVTIGNYGTFFATLRAAAADPAYKSALIHAGETILGSRHGFFVNPPATNTVVECLDGILFVHRGPTGEYADMYHQLAAGHHNPTDQPAITLGDLVNQQIKKETNVPPESVSGFRLNGVALSTGRILPGTEKAEVLTSARVNLGARDIYQHLQLAPENWETRLLYLVPFGSVGEIINGTFDSSQPASGFQGVTHYKTTADGDKKTVHEYTGLGRDPKTDPYSVSYWVPVGAAGLLMHLGQGNFERYLPQRWR